MRYLLQDVNVLRVFAIEQIGEVFCHSDKFVGLLVSLATPFFFARSERGCWFGDMDVQEAQV